MINRRKALIVVNLAGFLTFLWNDICILQDMGFEVSIAMNGKMADGSQAVEISKLDQMGIVHYQIDFDSKNPFSKQNYTALKQLKEIMKNGYSFIHCHTPISGLLTRIAARKFRRVGTKVVYTTHGFAFTDQSTIKEWIIYYFTEKIASLFTDAIITINHEDFNNAKRMFCRKVYLISSVGLNTERFVGIDIDREKYRNSIGVKNEDIMILAVGELSHRKNHQVVIRALGRIASKERYVFVICGRDVTDSGMENYLRDLAEENGVRLILAGHRSDIPQMNSCADIAVIPSLREGLGMSGLEALASGLPVVGSDVQGIREYVVDGETGYLCDPKSPETFTEAIQKLVDINAREKESMKRKCINTAYKFDKSVSRNQMKQIYHELCSGIDCEVRKKA